MRSYIMNIQVQNSNPSIGRHICISDNFTLQQLHGIISKLFGWEETQDYQFAIGNKKQKNYDQSIYNICEQNDIFYYQYGMQEKWILEVAIEASSMVEDPTLTFISYHENHPPYGIGGINAYHRILKEAKNSDYPHFQTIHTFLEVMASTFNKDDIDTYFTRLLNQHENIEVQFQRQLHVCREAFEQAKMIAPNLVMISLSDKMIPCYLDQLDNGMELMLFPDESSFVRSVMNATNEDPDLLFTDAWTIDFLYQPCCESDLYLSEGKNLCFRNRPGYLPQRIQEHDMHFLVACLEQLTYVLKNAQIPTLVDEKMVVVKDKQITVENIFIQENIYALSLSQYDHKILHRLPHTNEHISIFMVALPNQDSEITKKLHIRLVAQSKHDDKEADITLDSMADITDQLYPFLMELFQEHGIPEAFSFNNINLANLFSDVCQSLDIACIVGKPQGDVSSATMDFILEAMMNQDVFSDMVEKEQARAELQHIFLEEEPYLYHPEPKRKILN